MSTPVLPKLVGQRVKRREDPRLIQGLGTYVDDVKIVDLLGNTLFSDDMEISAGWTPSGTPGFRWVTKSTTQ